MNVLLRNEEIEDVWRGMEGHHISGKVFSNANHTWDNDDRASSLSQSDMHLAVTIGVSSWDIAAH